MGNWLVEKAIEELLIMWLKTASRQIDEDLKNYYITYDANTGLLDYTPKVKSEPRIAGINLDSSQGERIKTITPEVFERETGGISGGSEKTTLSGYQAKETGNGENDGLFRYDQSLNKIVEYLAAINDRMEIYYETIIFKVDEFLGRYAGGDLKAKEKENTAKVDGKQGDAGTMKASEKQNEKQDPNKWQSKTLWDNVVGSAKVAWKQVEADAKKHLQNVLKGTESFSDAFQSVWSLMANKTKQILQERLVSHVQDILRDRVLKPINDWLTKHIIDPVSNWLSNMIGGLFGFKAEGGPVEANKPYFVGERGMELFVPQSAGTIIPNDKLAVGQTRPVTVNVINKTGVQASATAETKFDGQRYVVDVFLDAYARNVNGMRDVLAARR